jgi:hypothetical protein
MANCKKCLASGMRVNILSSGFCQECQSELDWKNGDRVRREQIAKAHRVAHYEKAKRYVNRKWKNKYGDASVDEVLGYE